MDIPLTYWLKILEDIDNLEEDLYNEAYGFENAPKSTPKHGLNNDQHWPSLGVDGGSDLLNSIERQQQREVQLQEAIKQQENVLVKNAVRQQDYWINRFPDPFFTCVPDPDLGAESFITVDNIILVNYIYINGVGFIPIINSYAFFSDGTPYTDGKPYTPNNMPKDCLGFELKFTEKTSFNVKHPKARPHEDRAIICYGTRLWIHSDYSLQHRLHKMLKLPFVK